MDTTQAVILFIITTSMLVAMVAVPLWIMSKLIGGLAISIKKTIVKLR